MAKKQSLIQLIHIMEGHKANGTDMVFKNYFSMACHLSLQGDTVAAKKALRSLLDWLGNTRRQTYFNNLLASFEEYAEDYAWEIMANCEFNELILRARGK